MPPINANWQRDFSAAKEEKITAVTYTGAERSGAFVVEGVATIGGTPKLLTRIVINPVISGARLIFRAKVLTFSGAANSNYTSPTNPPDSAATNATTAETIALPNNLDLDAFMTAAGVPRTDPNA